MDTIQLPQRENYRYHAYYCEENIWHLCQQPELQNSEVVVIASKGDVFPILCQRAAVTPDTPLFWDYHVVLLWHSKNEHYILDFDTTLPFCIPITRYIQRSFVDEQQLNAQFIPLLRVMSANEYIANLQSDRSHMKTADGWLAEPPSWSPISTCSSNLHQFTDMTDDEFGQVLTVSQWLNRLS